MSSARCGLRPRNLYYGIYTRRGWCLVETLCGHCCPRTQFPSRQTLVAPSFRPQKHALSNNDFSESERRMKWTSFLELCPVSLRVGCREEFWWHNRRRNGWRIWRVSLRTVDGWKTRCSCLRLGRFSSSIWNGKRLFSVEEEYNPVLILRALV